MSKLAATFRIAIVGAVIVGAAVSGSVASAETSMGHAMTHRMTRVEKHRMMRHKQVGKMKSRMEDTMMKKN